MRKFAFFGVALFVASIPLQMALFEMHAYVGSIPRLIGFGAFVLGMTGIFYESRIRRLSRTHLIMFFFVLWSGLSYVWSVHPESTWPRVFTYAQLGVMVWLIAQYAQSEIEVARLRIAYVMGCFVPIGQLLLGVITGTAVGGISALSMQYARFGAFSEDPNELALGLVIAIPFAWQMYATRTDWLKWVGALYVPIGITAIGLTGSRGGALAAAFALLVVPLTFRQLSRNSRIVAVVGIVLSATFFVLTVPETTRDRLILTVEFMLESDRYARTTISDADIRVLIWIEGLKLFADSPLLGVGSGAYAEAIPRIGLERRSGHSAWIQVLTETGLVGFALWMGIIGITLYTIRLLPPAERMMWLCSLGAWMLGSTFLGTEYGKDSWMLLGLIAARSVPVFEERRRLMSMLRIARFRIADSRNRMVPA